MIWSRPELRVLFVCTANLCRSPLAEGLLRQRLSAMGLAGRVQVRSAGTCGVQRGRRPDPRVVKLAADAGISLARIRARKLSVQMIQRSDYVLVMERRHLDDVGHLCSASDFAVDALSEKFVNDTLIADNNWPRNVQLLGSYLPFQDATVKDIPDPYFGDWQGFDNVYKLIDLALTGFLACVQRRLGDFRNT